MSHAYCPECGFQNPEAANYCARCGSYLRRDELGETTLSIAPEEIDDSDVASLSDDELRSTILELEREEDDISLHRRVLHGRIDILRAERERRRRGGLHVEPTDLGPILGGSSR